MDATAAGSASTALMNKSTQPSIQSSNQCFNFVSDEQLSVMTKGVVPHNTDKSALTNFEAWRSARKIYDILEILCPDDLFMSNDPAMLNTHLSAGDTEVRGH